MMLITTEITATKDEIINFISFLGIENQVHLL